MVKNRRSNDLGDIRAVYVHPKSYCGNDHSESTLRTAKLTDDVFFGGNSSVMFVNMLTTSLTMRFRRKNGRF